MKSVVKTILLISVICIVNLSVLSQSVTKDDENAFEMTISVEDKCYRIDKPVKITVSMKNTTDKPIYLYKEQSSVKPKGFELLIFDSSLSLLGHRDPIRFIPVRKSKSTDYVKIEPSKSLSFSAFTVLQGSGVRKQGEFSIIGKYESPVFMMDIPEELNNTKVWYFEDKNLYSSQVWFTAKNKC